MALLSTIPIAFKKMFSRQSVFFQFALVLGNIIMLTVLFTHDHLSVTVEMLLNSIGGLSLAYVHFNNLKMK